MFASRPLSQPSLIEFSRSLRFSLSSGTMLVDALAMIAQSGTRPVRRPAARLVEELKNGWSFHDALDKQPGVFPPLFRSLAAVGEETGYLPEVMGELEKYYQMQQRLRQEFVAGIAWPVFQFAMAVLVITGLIYVLGEIMPKDGKPFDALGLGLVGADGAVRFLAGVFGTLAAGWLLFLVAKAVTRGWPVVDQLLFRVPVLGGCLRAMAITRFSISLQLMLDAGVSLLRTFKLAFTATDNDAFAATAPKADAMIRRGNTIAEALAATRLFPQAYLSAVVVGEDSGRLPEMLRQQAEYYDDLAKRRLAFLNRLLSSAVWMLVAAVIVVAIYRVFKYAYYNQIMNALKDTGVGGVP